MTRNWHRVSRTEPCPICQHADWCLVSNDGEVCICQRVESDRPTRNSGGWVHRLGPGRDEAKSEWRTAKSGQRRDFLASQPRPSTSASVASYFAALPTAWHNAQERMCAYLEGELGLPKDVLVSLDWRWDAAAKAVAIPMRNAWGEVTGIRYRALKTGAKWSRRGSKDGLFFDPCFIPYDPDELVVCEGPTDCAAALACGFWTVGRSSCGTGRDAIRDFMKINRVRRVTIVADDDKPKPRPGGGTWQPGLEGARRLAEQLKCAYRIVLPPIGFKDLREWYRAGTLDAKSFKAMCQGNDWHGPGGGNA